MNKKILMGAAIALAATTLSAFAAIPNTLVDVTNGSTIRGITTPANATGFAKAAYTAKDGYKLHAVINSISDPEGDDFYEGWVVRKSPFAFISTGKLTKESDGWHNIYNSNIDYSDYDFYVLTLEPNDGNDAPADHIVEGDVTIVESFTKKSNTNTSNNDDATQKSTELKNKIEKAVLKLPDTKKQKLKQKVIKLQTKLPKLNISDSKRERYKEILDILLDVL